MNIKIYGFYHLIPNPSPQGEGSRHPSQSRRGAGGEVTLSSLVEGLSLPAGQAGMRWSKARFLEMAFNNVTTTP